MDIRQKFQKCREELDAVLIERSNEIDNALVALASHESILFVGQPGTAKSHTILSLFRWIDAPKFDILLSKFTAPEECFGPVALSKLSQDRYVRNTDRRLPQAHVALFDEVFKASAAIRGTLLRATNEKIFENDGIAASIPLKAFFGASNEWPNSQGDGKEDHAIFDRFVIRQSVKPISSREGRERLRFGGDHIPTFSTTLPADELAQTRNLSTRLPWTPEAKECLNNIDTDLTKEGIHAGDRRNFKAIGIASAYAWLNGADKVEPESLEVLSTVLWDAPETEQKTREIVSNLANPLGQKINGLLLETEQIIAATDLRNLATVISGIQKLGEIGKKMSTLKSSKKLESADRYVKSNIKRLKLATTDLI